MGIWDWRAGEQVGHIEGVPGNVHWDSTGTRLLVSALFTLDGDEAGAAVWDVSAVVNGSSAAGPRRVPTTDRLATLVGHRNWLQEAVWSPDGTMAATCSGDGSARLWDTGTGHQLLVLIRSGLGGFCRLRFSPDGRMLAVADPMGGVDVLAVPLEDLASLARDRLTRTWQREECREYLDLDECPG